MPEAAIWLLFTRTGLSSIPVFKHFPGLGHLVILRGKGKNKRQVQKKAFVSSCSTTEHPFNECRAQSKGKYSDAKKNYLDFAFNHFTPVTNVGYTGFLLQRQLNPAEMICKLALVESLQVPEITGLCPNPTVIKVETWWKHYNLCVATL